MISLSAYDLHFFKKNYKLGPEIGRGGFGVVYSGFRNSDRKTVAIKYVARRNVTEWAMLKNKEVPLEIALLEQCRECPGVIRLMDWYERQDGYLLVMERPSPYCDLVSRISFMLSRITIITTMVLPFRNWLRENINLWKMWDIFQFFSEFFEERLFPQVFFLLIHLFLQ